MVISNIAAQVAINFMLQDHSFLGPNPFQIRRELITKYNGIDMDIVKKDPLWPSEEVINDYNKRYSLALLEEMKKKVTYEEYLAWGIDLGDARPCEFRDGQCGLFCEKFMECMGD